MKTKLVKYNIQVTWKLPHEKFPNLNELVALKALSFALDQLHVVTSSLDSTVQVSSIVEPIRW